MKASVQLGLLCLSLLISILDGGQIHPESSIESLVHFDAEDYSQFQVAENEEEQNLMTHDSDISSVNFRIKRQDNGKRPKRKKPRLGSTSTLAVNLPTIRVARQTDERRQGQRKRPKIGMFSVLAKQPPQETPSPKILTE